MEDLMNLKNLLVAFALALSACGVELRDKNKSETQNIPELVVENEYSLAVPLIQSQQTFLRFGRLVLKPGAKFLTQGTNVHIEVDELISDDGTIASFKELQIAPPQTPGRDGGHLELIVRRASGHLTLAMRGEQGGKGAPGATPDATMIGSQGAPGVGPTWVFTVNGPLLMQNSTNGAQGNVGCQGHPGEIGMPGGNSGTALIQISESDDFNVEYKSSVGQGGLGGDGGAGGGGGPGGPGGVDNIGGTIPGQPGPRGPQGPAGASGSVGREGLLEKICHQLGSENQVCE
jgi:hypothetical protein